MVYVRAHVRSVKQAGDHPAWWGDVADYFYRGETGETTAKALGLTARQVQHAREGLGLTRADGAGYNKKRVFERGVENRMARRLEDPVEQMTPLSECFKEGYQGQTGRVELFALSHETCKFPIDQSEGPTRYCGLPRVGNKSWCAHHFERCTGAVYRTAGHFRLQPMNGAKVLA